MKPKYRTVCDVNTEGVYLYRYYDSSSERNGAIHLEKFRVIKETPKSYWVIPSDIEKFFATEEECETLVKKLKRVVRKNAVRSYCYSTKEKAFASFRYRKMKQLGHLERKLESVKAIYEESAKGIPSEPHHYFCITRPTLFNFKGVKS